MDITIKNPKISNYIQINQSLIKKYLSLIIFKYIKYIHNLFNYIVYLAITLNLIIKIILIFNTTFISLYLT